ncbi:MAG: SurA N-terminal domain-containing protein [Gammaproteobacteria bacterium]
MQEFRNLLKGWFGKVLLAIFILPFAFFGIEGIFLNSGRADVGLSVNGVEVSKAEVDRAIANQRDALVQRMGGNVDPSLFSDDMLRPRVIDSLIERELLTQAVKAEGLYVSPETIKSYVRDMPQFKDDATGVFSQEKLESMLARAGYTPVRFYAELSADMVSDQLRQGVGLSAFTTETELKELVKLDSQKRDVSYATLSLEPFKSDIDVSDEEVASYFEANQAQYRTEEKVKIQYLVFKSADFAKDVEVSEDEILAEYDHYAKAQSDLERRRASHILVEVNDDRSDDEARARIAEAQAKLQAGGDFAELAKTYSDDTATAEIGGDLDFAGRGIYDEAFEKALFALNQGQVSDIVKTEFGYHLIKLTGVEAQSVASLDEKREEMRQRVADTKAAERLNAAIDELNELTYAAGDLSAVSERFGKAVQESDLFTRRGGAGIAADPKVLEAAFSEPLLKEGLNSSAIELADGSVAVLRVSQHEPERTRSLEEVRDEVLAALELQKAREKAKTTAEEIVASSKGGEALDALAAKYNLTWKHQEGVTRQATEVPRTVVSKLFEMPHPGDAGHSAEKVSMPSGDQDIVVLTKVTEGEFALDEKEAMQAKLSFAGRVGQIEFQNYVATLRENAEIVIP